jgi:hypothetical protein
MQRLVLLLGVAGVSASTPSLGAVMAPRDPRTACELLSMAEVAAFLRVPAVQIDSLNSGMNELTKVDVCSWFVHAGENQGVMLKLRRAPSADEVLPSFSAAEVDEQMSPPAEPTSIPGIGEEALYLAYADGTGGTIVVRQRATVVTIIGSASKEMLAAMAKKVLPRL